MAGMASGTQVTKARPKAYAGASGNTVLASSPRTLTAVTVNGGAGGGTLKIFDNATTNSGNVIFAVTLVAGQIDTFVLPLPIKAQNGLTANATANLGACSIHAY